MLGAGAAAACGTQLKEAAAVFGRRRAGEVEQSPICGEAPVSSARRGGRWESEQEELQPVRSQREGGSSDNRAALPRVVNTFKEALSIQTPGPDAEGEAEHSRHPCSHFMD